MFFVTAILSKLKADSGLPFSCPHDLLLTLAGLAESIGGTSGALYSLLFTAGAPAVQRDVSGAGWVQALGNGIQAIMK